MYLVLLENKQKQNPIQYQEDMGLEWFYHGESPNWNTCAGSTEQTLVGGYKTLVLTAMAL